MFEKGGSMARGLMGEAGPEAIMPLIRGSNGDLGVNAYGAGMLCTLVINMDSRVIARETVNLINNGIYTIEARGRR
jgi:lambda family phage tail tape measure protein